MSKLRQIYDEVARIHRDGGAVALATVIGTRGSTPGKATMKMLIRPDGSSVGSVGGGCVEAEVLERSFEVLRSGLSQRVQVELNEADNPETGLVCGGHIEIFIEPISMPTIILFGAGHVARAICNFAAPAGFRVEVHDDREGFATSEQFPLATVRRTQPFAEAARELRVGPDRFVLIMTRGHRQDLEVLRALAANRIDVPYLGLIGSKSKFLTLKKHLLAEGVEASFLERVRTPIGLPIGAQTAEEIAISVLAELIQLRRLGPSS
jgi:xanthine dehydrogenase accessory factor